MRLNKTSQLTVVNYGNIFQHLCLISILLLNTRRRHQSKGLFVEARKARKIYSTKNKFYSKHELTRLSNHGMWYSVLKWFEILEIDTPQNKDICTRYSASGQAEYQVFCIRPVLLVGYAGSAATVLCSAPTWPKRSHSHMISG